MTIASRRDYGGNSMVWPLKRVLMFPPVPPADEPTWKDFGYLRPMNHLQAVREHEALRQLIADAGVEIVAGEIDDGRLQDAIFPFDPSFITNQGMIVCRVGKTLRSDEGRLAEEVASDLGIPIAGRIEPPGTLDGGDCLWLDERTMAIGRGYRTNQSGIDQMSAILKRESVEVIPVGLPHWHGPAECLHLLSLISMIDDDLAVVYLPLLEAGFVQLLQERGVNLVEIPEHEFVTQASNVLVTAPRTCIMLRENPETAGRLIAAGCTVTFYDGGEISHNRTGGPTCLTRPLLREPA